MGGSYFDCVENDRWLYAQIVQGTPPGAKFCVSDPEDWPITQQQRLKKHFEVFKLGNLYSVKAGTEIAGIKQKHKSLFDRAGEEGLREALREDAASRFNIHTNSWQGALYDALSQSDWYCSIYFSE